MHHVEVALRDEWREVKGTRVFARCATGHAPPGASAIILVHGFVVTSQYMEPLARRLAPHFPVYAPDLPGFGNSQKPAHVLTVSDLADALAGWAATMGLERAVFLGNSFGCQVIALLAVRHPALVRALVLVGPTVEARRRTVVEQGLRLAKNALLAPTGLRALWLKGFVETGVRRALVTARYALDDRIETRLPDVRAPGLIVRGERDPVISQAWAEELTARLPEGRLVTMPGAVHALNYSEPRRLACVVRAFLATQHPAGQSINDA